MWKPLENISERIYKPLQLGYRFRSLDALVGYRYLHWRDTESDALRDLTLSGFMAGVRLHFKLTGNYWSKSS